MRDGLIDDLCEQVSGNIEALSLGADRLPNTIAFELPGNVGRLHESARHLVVATPQSSSPPDEMTRVLKAMGRSDAQVARTLRISMGWTTNIEQIDRAVQLIAEAFDGH